MYFPEVAGGGRLKTKSAPARRLVSDMMELRGWVCRGGLGRGAVEDLDGGSGGGVEGCLENHPINREDLVPTLRGASTTAILHVLRRQAGAVEKAEHAECADRRAHR